MRRAPRSRSRPRYSAASWSKDSYYFKLGDYVQLNTGAATNGGRVSFYSFAIKHGS